jgi:hypothetical protein
MIYSQPAANVVHHFSHSATAQHRLIDPQDSQNKRSKDFLAYVNERDGMGFIKDTSDTTLHQLVRHYIYL